MTSAVLSNNAHIQTFDDGICYTASETMKTKGKKLEIFRDKIMLRKNLQEISQLLTKSTKKVKKKWDGILNRVISGYFDKG